LLHFQSDVAYLFKWFSGVCLQFIHMQFANVFKWITECIWINILDLFMSTVK